MAKVDVKSAYRLIPVHPSDRSLLGMQWEGQLYVDAVLPFGVRSAPKVFTAVADALQWLMMKEGVQYVAHYFILDDFLFMGAPASSECSQAVDKAKKLCEKLGVLLAKEKSVGPSTVISFLGIEIGSTLMQLQLPKPKITKLLELLSTGRGRKRCTRKELESLIGHL